MSSKGKFEGVLLAATIINDDNKLFPTAYRITKSGNIESWLWFLTGVYEAIGMPNGLVLASDRQKELSNFKKIYSFTEHGVSFSVP